MQVAFSSLSLPAEPGDSLDGKALGFELAVQAALGKPRWLLTAMLPLAFAERANGSMDSPSTSSDSYVGNLTLWMTKVDEPRLAARSFLGVLFPVWSVGVVIPTGSRPSSREFDIARPLDDGLVHYRRDTMALLAGVRARADFFVLYSITLDVGVEGQLLDTGAVLMHSTAFIAFEPFSFLRRFNTSVDLSERIRFSGEWSYLRETGDQGLLPEVNGERSTAGVRHTFRAGFDLALSGGLGLMVRRELRTHREDGWNVSIRHAW